MGALVLAMLGCGGKEEPAPSPYELALREAGFYTAAVDAVLLSPATTGLPAARSTARAAAPVGAPAPLDDLLAALGAGVSPSCVRRKSEGPDTDGDGLRAVVTADFACADERSQVDGEVVLVDLDQGVAGMGLLVHFDGFTIRTHADHGVVRTLTLDGDIALRSLDRFQTPAAVVQTFTMTFALERPRAAPVHARADIYTLASYTKAPDAPRDAPLERGSLVLSGVVQMDHDGRRVDLWRFSDEASPLTWDETCRGRSPSAVGFVSGAVTWWTEGEPPLRSDYEACEPVVRFGR